MFLAGAFFGWAVYIMPGWPKFGYCIKNRERGDLFNYHPLVSLGDHRIMLLIFDGPCVVFL